MADTFGPGMSASSVFREKPNFTTPTGLETSPRRLVIDGSNPRANVDTEHAIDRWTQIFEFHFVEHRFHLNASNLLVGFFGNVYSKWVPTWLNDFTLTQDIVSGDDFIIVEAGSPIEAKYEMASDMRNVPYTSNDENELTNKWGIAIEDHEGDTHYRLIDFPSGIVDGPGDSKRINFYDAGVANDADILKTITKEQVCRASLVYRARVDGSVNYRYQTDSALVARLSFIEVFYEW